VLPPLREGVLPREGPPFREGAAEPARLPLELGGGTSSGATDESRETALAAGLPAELPAREPSAVLAPLAAGRGVDPPERGALVTDPEPLT
jgi:hypothetical protein